MEQEPQGVLGSMVADPKEVEAGLSQLIDPSAKWNAYTGAALRPHAGGFAESFGNSMTALAEGKSKEAELRARYLPLVEQNVLRKQTAALQQQKLKEEQAARWGAAMLGSSAALLSGGAPFTRDDVAQMLSLQVNSGLVPAPVAQKYMESLPEEPEQLRRFIERSAIALNDPFRAVRQEKPVVVGEGAALVQPTADGKPATTLFQNPNAGGKELTLTQLITKRDALPPGDPNRQAYENMIRKMTTHAPGVTVDVNTGQKGFDNERKLAGDWRSEPIYKAHQEMTAAYAQINQSLDQGTPISDTAAATKIMKLLDPGSVVRESELAIAMASAGKIDLLENYAKKWLSGEKLTPQQRVDFKKLAAELFRASVKQYNEKRNEYRSTAAEYDLNADRIAGPESKMPPEPKRPLTKEELIRKYTQ